MKVLSLILLFIVSANSFAEDKKVEVKKDDKGATVYNFNFYKEEKKVLPVKSGGAVDLGVFSLSNIGGSSGIADLSYGLGLKLGGRYNFSNGGYIALGILGISVESGEINAEYGLFEDNYSNEVLGGYANYGSLDQLSSVIFFEKGVEANYLNGKLQAPEYSYQKIKVQQAILSGYIGPTIKAGSVLISGLVTAGVSYIFNSQVYEYFDYGGGEFVENEIKGEKVLPTLGFNIKTSYAF